MLVFALVLLFEVDALEVGEVDLWRYSRRLGLGFCQGMAFPVPRVCFPYNVCAKLALERLALSLRRLTLPAFLQVISQSKLKSVLLLYYHSALVLRPNMCGNCSLTACLLDLPCLSNGLAAWLLILFFQAQAEDGSLGPVFCP